MKMKSPHPLPQFVIFSREYENRLLIFDQCDVLHHSLLLPPRKQWTNFRSRVGLVRQLTPGDGRPEL